MTKEIVTRNGIISYEEVQPTPGTKRINIETARTNLLDLKAILDKNNINFSLIYGTLLGAVRENNFIKHDEDTDLAMLDEDKQKLLDILNEILDIDFKILRYDGKLFSISRNNEYIDFYFFKKSNFLYRKCDIGLKVKSKYLENTKDYPFLGNTFKIPKNSEAFLVDLYGKNWRTPVEDVGPMDYDRYFILRKKIRNASPLAFSVLSKLKKIFH